MENGSFVVLCRQSLIKSPRRIQSSTPESRLLKAPAAMIIGDNTGLNGGE
jgi:hypothetical protein